MVEATPNRDVTERNTDAPEWLYLGRGGWLLVGVIFLLNAPVGFVMYSKPLLLVGYTLFCVVGAYVLITVLKCAVRLLDR